MEPKPLPTMCDLRILAQTDVKVRAFLGLWESGAFPSLEQCLIALAIEQARIIRECEQSMINMARRIPPSF